MIVLSTNAASLKSKLPSFRRELDSCQAGLFSIQETHFSTRGKIALDNFEISEAIQKGKEKGGTMIAIHTVLRPVLIDEYNDPFGLLVVQIKVVNRDIRIISGYAPQENWPLAQREPFFRALEEEIIKAELAGNSVVIEADFHSKLGKEYIPKDLHTQD